MTGDTFGPKIMRKGGGGGTSTSTTTGDIAPTLKPAAQKTIAEAGTLYDQGQLGQIAGDQQTGALGNLATATKASAAGQQAALGQGQGALTQAQQDIRGQAGNITGQLDQTAALQNAQDILGGQRGQQALTGGLGGARAARANNQLASNVGANLAAQQAQFGNQAAQQAAGLYGQAGNIGAQAGQLGAQSAALGTQGAEADLATAASGQAYQQQQLDAPGQALAQYGQLLQTPGSFVGTSSTTTAPRQGGK